MTRCFLNLHCMHFSCSSYPTVGEGFLAFVARVLLLSALLWRCVEGVHSSCFGLESISLGQEKAPVCSSWLLEGREILWRCWHSVHIEPQLLSSIDQIWTHQDPGNEPRHPIGQSRLWCLTYSRIDSSVFVKPWRSWWQKINMIRIVSCTEPIWIQCVDPTKQKKRLTSQWVRCQWFLDRHHVVLRESDPTTGRRFQWNDDPWLTLLATMLLTVNMVVINEERSISWQQIHIHFVSTTFFSAFLIKQWTQEVWNGKEVTAINLLFSR